jgi:hypothetical protein
MSKTHTQSLAREWLAEHPEGDIHGPAFLAWCEVRDLDARAAREVRIAIVRARCFGQTRDEA